MAINTKFEFPTAIRILGAEMRPAKPFLQNVLPGTDLGSGVL